ncbi:hypothetical protein E4T47_00122 [Aureobasidium subglaciale]|nr:hypothetical protein E4T47_00122 [Aureobasidium subglaciale]
MATIVRGPATGRFYKVFHAWSTLANPTHQQRRCFVPTTIIAEDGHDMRIRKIWARDPEGPTDLGQIDTGLAVKMLNIHHTRIKRWQAHATFLPRLRAELGAYIEPAEKIKNNGRVKVRLCVPDAKRDLLSPLADALKQWPDGEDHLTNINFTSIHLPKPLRPLELSLELPAETANLLKEEGDELLLRIQTTFDVGLTFDLPSQKSPDPGMHLLTVTGKRVNVEAARYFIRTINTAPEEQAGELTKRSSIEDSKLSSTNLKQPQESVQLGLGELKSAYRTAMRGVPSSVVILTTKEKDDDFTHLRGMTCSSFTSVTLDPEPIVSFSIRRPSSTLDCIINGQPFIVNIPRSSAIGAQIADLFAKPHVRPHQPFATLQQLGLGSTPYLSTLAPYIRSRHIKTHLKCQPMAEKSLEIGDHTVIFARVIEVNSDKRLDFKMNEPILLAYAQGQYREILTYESIKVPKSKATKAAENTPDVPETPTSQSLQQEAKTPEAQVPVGPSASEVADREAADEISDAYWSMAINEDEGEEDAALEQRAADQRNVGDAEQPKDAGVNPAETPENEATEEPSGTEQAKQTPT